MSTSTIFINYRRAEDAYAAALLDVELSRRVGERNVFRASRSISPGADFDEAIDAAIGGSKVMLVLVGPRWARTFRAGPKERDYVLEEILEAMKRDILVVPVLQTGTPPIHSMKLPGELEGLKRRQYVRFDYRAFSQDVDHLVQQLREMVPELAASPVDWIAKCGSVWRYGLSRARAVARRVARWFQMSRSSSAVPDGHADGRRSETPLHQPS